MHENERRYDMLLHSFDRVIEKKARPCTREILSKTYILEQILYKFNINNLNHEMLYDKLDFHL